MRYSVLHRLEAWYSQHCAIYYPELGNSVWDRIEITNLDNPGWIVNIDLFGTPLEGVPFEELREDYESEDAWLTCGVQGPDSPEEHGNRFVGNGGPKALERMVEIFLDWAEANASAPGR